jgi:hypothetical protein
LQKIKEEKFMILLQYAVLKATPHKARLTAWQRIYLHIFRHLARKLLAGRQPSGVIFIQSDEKSDCVSAPPALCGIALIIIINHIRTHVNHFAIRFCEKTAFRQNAADTVMCLKQHFSAAFALNLKGVYVFCVIFLHCEIHTNSTVSVY